MAKRSSSGIASEVRAVQNSLQALDRALRGLSESLHQTESFEPAQAPRRKPKLSPRRREALKLQGVYMGYVRHLGERQKSQVKKLRATKGIGPAIAMAKRLVKA